MGKSDISTKHLIGTPVVSFNSTQDKAISETNAMIIGQNHRLEMGATCHNPTGPNGKSNEPKS